MSNVFLAPCDSPNFDDTARSAVDLDTVSDYPNSLEGMDEVRFWGARTGSRNESNFKKMQQGDLVLFYQEGKYVGTARVELQFEDEEGWASGEFWRGGSSYLIYTLTDFEDINVPMEKVNRIFGYNDGYYPQGLMRVSPDNIDKHLVSIKRALSKIS